MPTKPVSTPVLIYSIAPFVAVKDGGLASSLVESPDSSLITVFDNNKHHQYIYTDIRVAGRTRLFFEEH